jgi:hypothetical protein
VPGLEPGLDVVALLQLGRQTGGSREVVSLGAVGDQDLHGDSLVRVVFTLPSGPRGRNPRRRRGMVRFRWRGAATGPTVGANGRNLRAPSA